MICYLVRHGQDDESRRGGWSQEPLTEEGIRQVEAMAEKMSQHSIGTIYSSDLCRATQTAQILAEKLGLPVVPLSQFREVNNGDLAGMKNDVALERFPGLFWNKLDWEECYPNGESPKQFYERIHTNWLAFSEEILSHQKDVVLVTHGGVIHVVRAIIENKPYNNRKKHQPVGYAEIIPLHYDSDSWKEIENGTEILRSL